MRRSLHRETEAVLRGVTVALACLFPLLFLWVAWRRLHYPFEVDRMESGMLTSVWRLRQGGALYSPPSLSWAPFLYAPLFFYVSAGATKLVGVRYLALRLVSVLATVGSFALIFLLVRAEGRRRWAPALVATGIFASLYPFVNAWYDVGRVDSLALFFFLAALLVLRRGHAVASAPLWWLAFLTKQTFLPLGFALLLVEWRRPRRMLAGMAVYLALVLGSFAALQHSSHGWFRYYAFGTAGVIRWSFHSLVMFPFADVLAPLPAACALIALAALGTGLRWRERDGSYYAIVTVLLAAAIGYVRAHVGANLNAVIPLYAWLAILTGIALERLLETVESSPSMPGALGVSFPALLWLLAAVQLGSHLYRPAEIPTGNLAAREAFLTALRRTPGDVWVVDHSFDAILAGKPLHADMDALDAVLGRHDAATTAQFQAAFNQARPPAVVLDRPADAYQPEGLFTNPPFSSAVPLRVMAPGALAQGDIDQPLYTLLPCNAPDLPGSLADRQAGFVALGSCLPVH